MSEEMTPRQRVIAAMERRRADRIPVLPCLWLDHIARVAVISYGEVLAYPEKMYNAIRTTRDFYDVDGMRVLIMPPADWRDGTVAREVDGKMMLLSAKTDQAVATFDLAGGGRVQLIDDSVRILDRASWPVDLRVESMADVKKIPIPSARQMHSRGQTVLIRELVEKVAGRYFIVGLEGEGTTINPLIRFRGEQGLMDLVENPTLAEAIMERCTEAAVERAKALIDVGVDAVYFGDSSASSSMISPQHYSKFCLPAYRKFISAVRAYNPDVKLYQHCCGNYNPILEMAADEGADALHGFDPAQGMNITDVKRRVGDRVCIWGGVNTLTLLNGSTEEVAEESLQCMAGGGEEGYILDAACAIPPASPFENIQTMCRAPRMRR